MDLRTGNSWTERKSKPTCSDQGSECVKIIYNTSVVSFQHTVIYFYLTTYVFGLSLKCHLSERRWNPNRETTMKDLRWLSQSYICFYNSAFAELSVYFSFLNRRYNFVYFWLFQGISEIRHEILDMWSLWIVFVSAGFQEKFGFVGEEEGLQTPSRVRFDIQSTFLQKLYKKALNSAYLGVSQWLPQETKHACCSPEESSG